MKRRSDSNWENVVFGVIIGIFLTLAATAQTANYRTGEDVEVLSSGTWYKAKVLEAKTGQYKIHYEGWASSWDEWVGPDRIRRTPGYSADARAKWGPLDEWRGGYSVGDMVYFSISTKTTDFQPCTVTENAPEQVMRVKCAAYKDWVAGVYIVHSEGSIRKEPMSQTKEAAAPPTKTVDKGSSTSLKVGEYACIGVGGRMMIGLGFKVLSGNRYTDLDGGNKGTFTIAGGKVTFRGGHMEGISGRDLKDNWFTVGAQASCGPF
jgi:hypothetical protein